MTIPAMLVMVPPEPIRQRSGVSTLSKAVVDGSAQVLVQLLEILVGDRVAREKGFGEKDRAELQGDDLLDVVAGGDDHLDAAAADIDQPVAGAGHVEVVAGAERGQFGFLLAVDDPDGRCRSHAAWP